MRNEVSKLIFKNIGFVAFCALLGVTYIYNTHKAEGKLRSIQKLKREVSDAKHHYHEIQNEIIYKSTESQLAKDLKDEKLKANDDAPVVLNQKS